MEICREDYYRIQNEVNNFKRYCGGLAGYGGEVSQVVVFRAVGQGFQVFGVFPVCDAYAFDFSVFCKADAFLFGDGGAVGKLVAGDASAAFYKSYDFFGIAFGLRDVIQRIPCQCFAESFFFGFLVIHVLVAAVFFVFLIFTVFYHFPVLPLSFTLFGYLFVWLFIVNYDIILYMFLVFILYLMFNILYFITEEYPLRLVCSEKNPIYLYIFGFLPVF